MVAAGVGYGRSKRSLFWVRVDLPDDRRKVRITNVIQEVEKLRQRVRNRLRVGEPIIPAVLSNDTKIHETKEEDEEEQTGEKKRRERHARQEAMAAGRVGGK